MSSFDKIKVLKVSQLISMKIHIFFNGILTGPGVEVYMAGDH